MKKLFLIVTPFFFNTLLHSQNFEGATFKLKTENQISTITFEDDNSDGYYLDGQFMKSFGRVSLTKSELDGFLVNLKKISLPSYVKEVVVADSVRTKEWFGVIALLGTDPQNEKHQI